MESIYWREIIEDPRGPLYFDPDTLIYYFYNNRLNHLWIQENENFQEHMAMEWVKENYLK